MNLQISSNDMRRPRDSSKVGLEVQTVTPTYPKIRLQPGSGVARVLQVYIASSVSHPGVSEKLELSETSAFM